MLRVHSIETFGTHEGPGIRFVLFLQWCLFKCLYCHNPDTIPMDGGSIMSQEGLIKKILKMKPYFGKKWWLTVSGGEPLLQAQALLPFFKELKERNINIAVDTNGFIRNEDVEALIPYVDLFLLDLKHMNNYRHQKLTGKSNDSVHKFLDHLEANNKKTRIRYVLVPEYSDQDEYIHELGKSFGHYACIDRIEILPYHNLWVYKRHALGREYALKDVGMPTPQKVSHVKHILAKYFAHVFVR